jgi:hypothetical protein
LQQKSAIEDQLFDQFVCAGDQHRQYLNPQCFGGFEVDNKLELGRLLDREILNDRSTAKRKETMANHGLVHFMAQLPLGRKKQRVWNNVAGCLRQANGLERLGYTEAI